MDNSLLRPPEDVDGEPRLRMLETIREFALERLIDSGEADAIHSRHAQYYLSLAERAEVELHRSTQQVWYRRLEAELDNLRAAMSWMLDHGQNEYALRIAMALLPIWETRGYGREGLQWLETGLAGASSIPDAVRAEALTRAGALTGDLGDYNRAIAMLQESLALWRRTGDLTGIALTLSNLGARITRQGDYAKGTAMLEEALELRRKLDYQPGTIGTLYNLGVMVSEHGDSERAIELLTESLALARAAGHDNYTSWILNALGEAYATQGDYDRAGACYTEAEQIFQRLADYNGAAFISGNRGVIALKQGNDARAFRLLAECILAFQELGHKEYALLFMERLATVTKEMHHPDRAVRLLSAGESLRQVIGVARTPVDQLDYDACLAGVRSQLDEAAFAAAWAEGGAMAFEQAVAYALAG